MIIPQRIALLLHSCYNRENDHEEEFHDRQT